jgi:hypothetical protein
MRHGKAIWEEDDATPGTEGHETLSMAWQRLFGEQFDRAKALQTEDGGDADWLLMPNGKIVCSSFPGQTGIYEPRP